MHWSSQWAYWNLVTYTRGEQKRPDTIKEQAMDKTTLGGFFWCARANNMCYFCTCEFLWIAVHVHKKKCAWKKKKKLPGYVQVLQGKHIEYCVPRRRELITVEMPERQLVQIRMHGSWTMDYAQLLDSPKWIQKTVRNNSGEQVVAQCTTELSWESIHKRQATYSVSSDRYVSKIGKVPERLFWLKNLN